MPKLSRIISTIFLIMLIVQIFPSFLKGLKDSYAEAFDLKAKVAIVKIKDVIVDSSIYVKNLRKFFENDDIKAILLNIESPGGSAGSSQAIYSEILSLKKEHPKPVVTLVNDLCASGGYYIACASDYIIASPVSLIGSIGSYIGSFKIKELLENYKIKFNVKQSGRYKTAMNPFTDNTSEVNDFIQSVSDDVYKQFMNDVAIHRKLSLDQADKWANGKFFTGKKAKELGLIDETGSESNAIKKIKELAMIEKEKKIMWIKATKGSKLSQMFGLDDNEENMSFLSSLVNCIVEKLYIKLNYNQHPKIMMQ